MKGYSRSKYQTCVVERKKRITEAKREKQLMDALGRKGELCVKIDEEAKKMRENQKKRNIAGQKAALAEYKRLKEEKAEVEDEIKLLEVSL